MGLKMKQKYLATLTVNLMIKVIPKLLILLDNSASRYWEPLHLYFNVGNESVDESLQKKQRKTVFLHKVYTPSFRNTLTIFHSTHHGSYLHMIWCYFWEHKQRFYNYWLLPQSFWCTNLKWLIQFRK